MKKHLPHRTSLSWLRLALLLALLWPAGISTAQEETPPAVTASGPVYVVQAGDSLWDIALRFGVSLEELAAANNLVDPGQLTEGAQLTIPGLEGVQGVLVTRPVSFGETLRSLSRRYQVPVEMLARLNHLSSPAELFAGYTLILPEKDPAGMAVKRSMVASGQSLLELAALQGTNSWAMVHLNSLPGTWGAVPGDVLLLPGEQAEGPSALPAEIQSIELTPRSPGQGKTLTISLSAADAITVTGSLLGHEFTFFPDRDGRYVALQGVHAMTEPGIYPLTLSGVLADGETFAFSQSVYVSAVSYPYDRPLTVDPATIDPAITRPEDAQWTALAQPITPERLWNGMFRMPSPLDQEYCVESGECWTSRFGNRRSYNGSPYSFFHTGLDFAGGEGTEIYAPAPGVVVFAGPLTVRGNATMIDHGQGVYTGYMHQSEILVEVGERVETGQVIGLVGGTGRVEGPHLHWEVWVGGVQVEPLDWLAQVFPPD